MVELINTSNRQLIPRWHTSRNMGLLQQYASQGLQKEVDVELFRLEDKKYFWEISPTINSATDLFVSLKLLNMTLDPLFKEVQSYLVSKKKEISGAVIDVLSPRLRRLDSSNTYATDKNRIYALIGTLKSFLKECPYDALTWNDLAFYYAVLGERRKAEDSMHVAYSLFSSHPFIARSYARLLVHYDEPDKAIHFLRKTGEIKHHPEILSADISIRIAFDLGNPDITTARRLLKKYSNLPSSISELSASIGTFDIKSGSIKRGKEYLIASAVSPTENTIAQLKWIAQQHKVIIPIENISVRSLEADAIACYNNKDYSGCRDALMMLHEFQPFSDGALADAGYISMVALDDPEFICNFIDNIEKVAPNSFIAKNNYIVAKIELGGLDFADKRFRELRGLAVDDKDKAVLSATFGMYLYSIGEIDDGKKLYEKTVSFFRATKNHFLLAMALLHQGKIESQLGMDGAKIILEKAKKEAKKVSKSPELLEKIERELSWIDKKPGSDPSFL